MTTNDTNPAIARYLEQVGLIWESQGLARIAGRIVSLLIVQDEPMSLDTIAGMLDVSKASVSTDARWLQRYGFIELVTKHGDRRDYYVIAPNLPQRILAHRLSEIRAIDAATEDALNLDNVPTTVCERLRHFRDFHRTVANALSKLLPDNLSKEAAPAPRVPTQLP